MVDLSKLIRPKIFNLEPYRCARDDFTEGILLDANENAHGPAIETSDGEKDLHRYPDPHQVHLKQLICNFRGGSLTPANICLGVGSDESIDAIIRAACVPGKDKILINVPTYGMYKICAEINDVDVVSIPLDTDFQLQTDLVLEALKNDASIKLVFITTPGNPTGTLINHDAIRKLLAYDGQVLFIADEAYVDFVEGREGSVASWVTEHDNLVAMQTVSKSFGLAGLRLGMTFASAELSRVLNAMKAPYNISSITSEIGKRVFSDVTHMENAVDLLNKERSRVIESLSEGRLLGGTDANFILWQLSTNGEPDSKKALYVYNKLARERGVVIRYRANEPGCAGCLRITIGTSEENTILLDQFRVVVSEYNQSSS